MFFFIWKGLKKLNFLSALGEILYRYPKSVLPALILIYLPMMIAADGYLMYPSRFEDLNQDKFRVDAIAYAIGKDAREGIRGYSYGDGKSLKYMRLPDRKALEEIVKKDFEDRTINIYWFYNRTSDYAFGYRSIAGFTHNGEAFSDMRKRYIEEKERRASAFHIHSIIYGVLTCFFMCLLGYSMFLFLFRKE